MLFSDLHAVEVAAVGTNEQPAYQKKRRSPQGRLMERLFHQAVASVPLDELVGIAVKPRSPKGRSARA